MSKEMTHLLNLLPYLPLKANELFKLFKAQALEKIYLLKRIPQYQMVINAHPKI